MFVGLKVRRSTGLELGLEKRWVNTGSKKSAARWRARDWVGAAVVKPAAPGADGVAEREIAGALGRFWHGKAGLFGGDLNWAGLGDEKTGGARKVRGGGEEETEMGDRSEMGVERRERNEVEGEWLKQRERDSVMWLVKGTEEHGLGMV
ncbi:hypothetical protein M0R45_019523 [Rubus argutus]|uniref:Uncharacterized protein n=1 Tax=Rubus argutus TaxID=59490 RepID=A0AAW1X6G8_RUBAR